MLRAARLALARRRHLNCSVFLVRARFIFLRAAYPHRRIAMTSEIRRDELQSKLDRGDKFFLAETLPADKFQHQHLPHAVNLPPDRIKDLAPTVLPDKNAEVVVYCGSSSCNASELAATELEAQGYRHVRRYVEGKQGWTDAGLPTESGARRQQAPMA
jgi:rhodanese-related sulfurtransferase